MISPCTMRPGGCGISRITLSAVTDLPEPDSPTMPSVSPLLMYRSTPSTARTTPSSVKKCVLSPLTSRSRSAMEPPVGYQRLVNSRNASSAREVSSASTSLWVTQRMAAGPIAWTFTLRAAQPFTSSSVAAGPRSTRTMTMFVCTLARSTRSPGSFASPSPRRRAFAWSSASRSTMRSRATMPAAARMPTCRMPPPSILRQRRARSMNSAEPQITEPTGADSPFDTQNVTESTGRAKSAAGRFRATAALNSRAPSRCTGTPASWATAATAAISSGVQQVPPWRLCVFSMQTSPVWGRWMFGGRSASRTCSGDRNPRSVFVGRICSWPITGAPATSLLKTCESKSSTTSWPGRVCVTTETRLPWVPEVTKRPAGLPSRSAASASKRRTVGSSPQTSSPTSARAMASRISGVGSVSVSERRSTKSCINISLSQARLALRLRLARPAASQARLALRLRLALPLGPQPLRGALAPFGVRVVVGDLAQELDGFLVAPLAEVHVGEQGECLGHHGRARIVLDDLLQALACAAGVTLVHVVGGHPHFLLRHPPAAHLDLRDAVGRVAGLRILFHELLELIHRLLRERLFLLDRLDLVVVGHREPELDEVRDLVAGIEGQERFELLRGLVEVGLAIVRLADQEARARRVRRVRVALDDLAELLARLRVALLVQLGLADLIELLGGKDRRRLRFEPRAAGREQEKEGEEHPRHRGQRI